MARRITSSQFRSKLRQLEAKRRQAINKYNQEVRRYNQNLRSAASKYNHEVRAHNARVRARRQHIKNELARLSGHTKRSSSPRYAVYSKSVITLQQSYVRLESRADSLAFDARYNRVLDLSEREAANSLEVANIFFGVGGNVDTTAEDSASKLVENLRSFSADLCDMWGGAVFALNRRNPDAARHFCTSSREIITQIIDTEAPDADVFALLPDCDTTDRGNPTRRAKLKYFLHRRGMTDETFERFLEDDIENIVQLFRLFNDGTHGSAGIFDFHTLRAVKKRVEDSIMFLTEVIGRS